MIAVFCSCFSSQRNASSAIYRSPDILSIVLFVPASNMREQDQSYHLPHFYSRLFPLKDRGCHPRRILARKVQSIHLSEFQKSEQISRHRPKVFFLFYHSIVFFYFFALITEEGFLISPWFSLELCIQMGISFLFSFAFSFYSFHSYL